MSDTSPVLIAAIDVGSSAIRMEIAEVNPDGSFRLIEKLSKAVSLGRDTFTAGGISEETMQMATQALTDFSRVMKSYSVTNYRAIATSAVREASNADTFIDRAFMRSGIEIDVIGGSEENRLTYLAIQEALRNRTDLDAQNYLVVEVGGGSTDISLTQAGKTLHSGTFALGSLRLRQSVLSLKTEARQRIKILERQIKNTVDQIALSIPFDKVQEVIALGGDIRFAAREITGIPAEGPNHSWTLTLRELISFCNDIVKLTTDEMVRKFNITYPEADTLAPALLAYRMIFERTSVQKIYVLNANIRLGLLLDMARRASGKTSEFLEEQILASARAIARKYQSSENHIEQVRRLSLSLFDQLRAEHGLESRERLLLEIAAILHDVGSFISDRSHHKHTYYVISSSEIFGLSRDEINLIANIARYHRKSPPTRAHLNYMSLDRDSRMIVSKLSAILRIADAIDQDYSNKVKSAKIIHDQERNRYILEVESDGDLSMERLSLEKKSDLFREIFGKPIVLQPVEKLEPA